MGATLAAIAATLIAPAAAAGHAALLSSTPPHEAVLAASPRQIVLRFSEPVQATSVRVFDGVARRVAVPAPGRPRPDTVVVPIARTLPRDSYTVVWRVVSADTEPVDGFVVFHVGAARSAGARTGAAVPAAAATTDDDHPRGFVARAAGALLLLLSTGGAVALAVARGAAGREARRSLTILAVVAGGLAATALLDVAVEVGTGEDGLSRGLGDVLGTRFGAGSAALAVLATTLAAVALVTRGGGVARVALPAPALGAVVAAAVRGGGDAAALLAEAAHLTAAGIWLGGTAFVLLGRGAACGGRPAVVALAAAGVLLVTGVARAAGHLATWGDVTGTAYGRLLALKTALLAATAVAAAVAWHASADRRRASFVQVGVLAAAVVVAARLAATSPAVAPAAQVRATPSPPFRAAVAMGPFSARVSVAPARVGVNRIDLALPAPTAVQGGYDRVRVRAVPPAAASGAVTFDAVQQPQLGRFSVRAIRLPSAGRWTLELSARRGADAYAATVAVPVAGTAGRQGVGG